MSIRRHIWIIVLTTTLASDRLPEIDYGKLEPKCLIKTGLSHLLTGKDYVDNCLGVWSLQVYSENKNFKYLLVSPFKTKSTPITLCLCTYVSDISFPQNWYVGNKFLLYRI